MVWVRSPVYFYNRIGRHHFSRAAATDPRYRCRKRKIEVSDAGRVRDFLFERGMSSSSLKRVFLSVRAVITLAIREHDLSVTTVFSGTFIQDDEAEKKRLPIPADALIDIHREFMALNKWLKPGVPD